MKSVILAAGFVVISVFSMNAFASSQEDIPHCGAQLIYLDGTFNDHQTVECEGDFAGRCVEQVIRNGKTDWKIVDDSICDAKAASQAASNPNH